MQSRIEAATQAFIGKMQSTHDDCVQASAAYMVLQLREDFSQGKECDLTEAELAFIKSEALKSLKPANGIPETWDDTYKNCRGLFAMLREIFAQPFFNDDEYLIICKNIQALIALKKDHWSTKKYYENGAVKTIEPSMGEVVNLTCFGLLNDEAFDMGTQSIEVNRAHRVYSLYRMLLTRELLCTTGLSNNFLFLLNGYKNIYIVEIVLVFLHNLTLEFVAAKLLEEFKDEPEKLYQLILSKFDINGTLYEMWLADHQTEIETYLSARAAQCKLDPLESKRAIKEIIDSLSDLDIPSDLNPAIILPLKTIFQITKPAPFANVKTAIQTVKNLLTKTLSLDAIPREPLADFYHAIELLQQCEHYNHSKFFLIGEEGGQLREAVETLQNALSGYFHYITRSDIEYQGLTLTDNITTAAKHLETAIQAYHAVSNEPFVRDFFVLVQSGQGIESLFNKMDTLRAQVILSDADITAYYYQNLNIELREISISPFEMNRFMLHALWVNPGDWSDTFRVAFERVLAWFKDENDHNALESAFKAAYVFRDFIDHISLLFLITSSDAPAVSRQAFERFYQAHQMAESDGSLFGHYNNLTNQNSGFSIRYSNHLTQLTDYLCSDEFLKKLAPFSVYYGIAFALLRMPSITKMQHQMLLDMYLNAYLKELLTDSVVAVTHIMQLLCAVQDKPALCAAVGAFISEHESDIVNSRYPIQRLTYNLEFIRLNKSNQALIVTIFSATDNIIDLFVLKDALPVNSPQRIVITDKIKRLSDSSEKAVLTFDDFVSLCLHYANNIDLFVEMCHLLEKSVLELLSVEDRVVALLSIHKLKNPTLFYNTIISGRLTQFIKTFSSLHQLMRGNGTHTITKLIETDIFLELNKPETTDKPFIWSISEIYSSLSEEGRERLLQGLEAGQFGSKLAFHVKELRTILVDQSPKRASAFLKKRPASWTQALLELAYAEQQGDGAEAKPLEDYSPQCLLTAYFRAFFKTKKGTLKERNDDKLDLILRLIYHFKPEFKLTDSEIDFFMWPHADVDNETASRIITIGEPTMTAAIMHALTVLPHEWSPKFKEAFALVLEALKNNLNLPEENALNAPLCLPTFVYNLSGLLAVTRCCRDFPLKFSQTEMLLSLTDEYNSPQKNPFMSNYIVNLLQCADSFLFDRQELPAFNATIFNALKGELTYHLRSTNDVRVLLKIVGLKEEDYQSIYDTGMRLLEENKLQFNPRNDLGRPLMLPPGSARAALMCRHFSLAISEHYAAHLQKPEPQPASMLNNLRFFIQKASESVKDPFNNVLHLRRLK